MTDRNIYLGGKLDREVTVRLPEPISMMEVDARFKNEGPALMTAVFRPMMNEWDNEETRLHDLLGEDFDPATDNMIMLVVPPMHSIHGLTTRLWPAGFEEMEQAIYSPAADPVDFRAAKGVTYEILTGKITGTVDPLTGVISHDPTQTITDLVSVPGFGEIKADDFSVDNIYKSVNFLTRWDNNAVEWRVFILKFVTPPAAPYTVFDIETALQLNVEVWDRTGHIFDQV